MALTRQIALILWVGGLVGDFCQHDFSGSTKGMNFLTSLGSRCASIFNFYLFLRRIEKKSIFLINVTSQGLNFELCMLKHVLGDRKSVV